MWCCVGRRKSNRAKACACVASPDRLRPTRLPANHPKGSISAMSPRDSHTWRCKFWFTSASSSRVGMAIRMCSPSQRCDLSDMTLASHSSPPATKRREGPSFMSKLCRACRLGTPRPASVRSFQADHSTAVFAGLAQRNADLLRGEKHIGGSEDLRVFLSRLGIPRAGPGVIAVAGKHGGIDETQL